MSDWLKTLKKKAAKRPDVMIFYGPEGSGKTSFAAQFRDATFMMSENESGLLTLMQRGLVPDCDHFPEFTSFRDVEEATVEMVLSPKRPRTFVVDTMNGIESLLHASVCEAKYDGEMTKKGFLNFQEGYTASVIPWRRWLANLDRLRNAGTTVVLLGHSKTVNYRNPEGADFHRFVPEVHETTWSATKKFADLICFMNFNDQVEDVTGSGNVRKTGKGIGGRTRVFHFERSAAFDAKNRHGLPSKIVGTGSAAGDFGGFVTAIKGGSITESEQKNLSKKSKGVPVETSSAEADRLAAAAEAADDGTADGSGD